MIPAQNAAYLEGEEGLEVVVHFSGVGAAPPMPRQVVRVCHHLQQRQLRLKGHTRLLDESPAESQNNAQDSCPPEPNRQPTFDYTEA